MEGVEEAPVGMVLDTLGLDVAAGGLPDLGMVHHLEDHRQRRRHPQDEGDDGVRESPPSSNHGINLPHPDRMTNGPDPRGVRQIESPGESRDVIPFIRSA